MIRLYKNIKRLRKERGLTQEQLAEQTGYSKATISKIEHADIDLSHSSIMKFAEFFEVYPGDLMGWDDKDNDEFTPDERAVINRYRLMNRKGRNNILEYMDAVLTMDKYRKSKDI